MCDDPPRIADIPSFAKIRDDIQGMKALAQLRPLFHLAGVHITDDLVARFQQLESSSEPLLGLPDRFNDLFAARGWIAYELMNADVMLAATEIGEHGDVDGGEQLLVAHYDEKTIAQGIQWLLAVKAFQPREGLARLALDDYVHDRYYSCVPLVLMVLDGVVNETHGSRGFFAEAARLTAWDSVSAHSRGLQTLHGILTAPRTKTTTEDLSLPYRHGILHGQDLGYANSLVAAKTWAALFAIRAWALAAQNDRLEAPPAAPEPTLRELVERLEDTKAERHRISQWTPRPREHLATIPTSGSPEDYDPTTPEATVVTLLDLWKRKNYGGIAALLPPVFRKSLSKAAGEMRRELGDKQLVSFEITSIEDEGPAITEVKVRVTFLEVEQERTGTMECRVVSQDEEGTLVCRGFEDASWFFWPRLVQD